MACRVRLRKGVRGATEKAWKGLSYNSGLDDEGFLGPIWSATAQTLRQMLQQHNQLPEVEGPFYLCHHSTSLTRYMNRLDAIIRRCILLTSDVIYILTGVSRLLLFTTTVERVDHSCLSPGRLLLMSMIFPSLYRSLWPRLGSNLSQFHSEACYAECRWRVFSYSARSAQQLRRLASLTKRTCLSIAKGSVDVDEHVGRRPIYCPNTVSTLRWYDA